MVTIKDIAKVAGVSHTTVSRALNDSASIRPETKERIQQIARELNYVTNYSAKSLVHQKSYTIGLYFSSMHQSTSASFLKDVLTAVTQQVGGRYHISVNALDMLDSFISVTPQRFDGIILMSQSDSDDPFIYHVKQKELPLVVINRQLEDNGVVNVVASDRLGVASAIDSAVELGHRRIGFIGGNRSYRSSIERKAGFLDGMFSHDLPVPPDYLCEGDYSISSGRKEMGKLLRLPMPPTCVFCANDDMAIGAIKACYAASLEIPKDISIIGFDDISFATYTTPALSTVHKPLVEISRRGTEMLLNMIEGTPVKPELHVVETHMEHRESLGAPREKEGLY